MKLKNIVVKISPLENGLKSFTNTFSDIKSGKKVTASSSVSFNSVETFRKFFTNKRLELLTIIKKENPKSIYMLAKIANREYKNVHNDVEILEKFGLIKKDDKQINIDFNKLVVEITV